MAEKIVDMQNIQNKIGDFTLNVSSLTIEKGTIMCLVGNNGAGKTVLIKHLMGLIYPISGKIAMFSREIPYTKEIYEKIGLVFDNNHIPSYMTTKQINMFMRNVYSNWDESKFKKRLELYDVPQNKSYRSCSFGMKKKISLSVAYAHNPEILVLDEITAGLDPYSKAQVLNEIIAFKNQGNTVLISSHNMTDIERIADSISFIHDGNFVFTGNKNSFIDNFRVINVSEDNLTGLISKKNLNAIIGIAKSPENIQILIEKNSISEFLIYEPIIPTVEQIVTLFDRKEYFRERNIN